MEEKLSEITMNFSTLVDNALTADLYMLLHHKYHKNYDIPELIIEHLSDDEQALNYLQELEFIKIVSENQFELRQKGVRLFEIDTPEQKWLEFLSRFPIKVPSRNGGSRPLKIASPTSKGNIPLKKKYVSLVKNNPELG